MKQSDPRITRSLKYSVIDGTFYSVMVGFGESFFSAFAVFLNATATQLGLIGSLPPAVGSASEFFSNQLLKIFKTRKLLTCVGAFLQGLMCIPIALVFFLGEFRVWHLILFVSLYWIFGMIVAPAWNSWMGDLVPEKERGGYFGRRNTITGFASFVSLLLAGYLLQSLQVPWLPASIGFSALFIISFFARMMSVYYLTKKYEPPYRMTPEAEFSLLDFVKQARHRNFGLLVLYLVTTNFSVYFAGPFFAAYMLQDLHMSYLTFTIVSSASLLAKLIFMPIWGKACDRFGTRKVLAVSGILMPLCPALWIFSTDVWYLLLVQAYGGFVWAGFEIAYFTFMFDSTTPEKRATCVAYYNVLNGGAILLGAAAGSYVATHNHVFWTPYLLVFALSGMLRYAAYAIFVPRLHEVRKVERISDTQLLLKIVATMPTMGIVHRMITISTKRPRRRGKT